MDKFILALCCSIALVSCSDSADQYSSAEGMPKPYILKQDCKFTIVTELGKTGVSSPKLTGAPGFTASASVSLDDFSITVLDCKVTENSHDLPIYEN